MIELLKFSHDRKAPFKESCDALRDIIDAFAEQSELDEWYKHFETNYALPRKVIKQQMKSYIASSYDYRKCMFPEKFLLKSRLKSLLKHFGFLAYVIYKSRKYFMCRNYELIVEWIETDLEVKKFSKLIRQFKSVLIVNVNTATGLGFETINRPRYKYYDRKECIRSFFLEIKRAFALYFGLSAKLAINLTPIATHIVNQYLYYGSLFKYNRAKYCMQDRHYQTSAIKNHLFHRFGGKVSGCIQKNIIQRGHNGFYYDIDVLFSLGNKTAERAFESGARIENVVPVGSLYMEYYWFGKKRNSCFCGKKYDIVCIGGNGLGVGSKYDVSETYLQDYYEHFRWLVKFSIKNPGLRIGIIHHANNKIDENEMEIIKDSNVVRLDQKLDSYEVGFQSRFCVTFASTMGYELIAHGVPTLFLDPGRRNSQFLPDDDLIDFWRVTTYEEFNVKAENLLLGKNLENYQAEDKDLCLNSENVSERIFHWFNSVS